MKAPITDRALGINLNSYSDHQKFADVRQKAKDEYIERVKKRRKEKVIALPKYQVGDLIVIESKKWSKALVSQRAYILLEVVDFEMVNNKDFRYYGIVLRTTDPEYNDRIGRLYKTGWSWSSGDILNVPPESINWELNNK